MDVDVVAAQSCKFFVSTERGQCTVLTAPKVVSHPSEKPINTRKIARKFHYFKTYV